MFIDERYVIADRRVDGQILVEGHVKEQPRNT